MDEPTEIEDGGAEKTPPSGFGGFALEPVAHAEAPDQEPDTIERRDSCPSCGATLRGNDTLVCLRCGFDLKTLRKIETRSAKEEDAPGNDEETDLDPDLVQPTLVREGTGGFMLPAILGGLAAIISIGGILGGASGLIPPIEIADGRVVAAATSDWPRRFDALARYPAVLGLWTICGIVGLFALSWIRGRSFGDLGLAAARMLAIVAIAYLGEFIALPWPIVEFPTEAAVEIGAFVGLSIFLFRIGWRDASIVLGVTICALFALYVLSHLLAWVM